MSLAIHPYIQNYIPGDYATSLPSGPVKIDCSMGVNADLLGSCIFQRLHEFQQRTNVYHGNYADIKYYPHGGHLTDALASWYLQNNVGQGWLTGENFILGNGSYDILCNLNHLCLTRGKRVLGHAPQFTAYVDHVHCCGAEYDAYYMAPEDGYRFHARAYLAKMSEEHSLFILENPNNPTGQLLPLNDIRRIAQRALALDRILVVDEAYGEYIPFSSSAINLLPEFPNLIVTRSFSKGWGMAGVRLGYAVASPHGDLLPQLHKLVLPFNSNGIARVLAQTALQSKFENPADPFGIRPVQKNKRALTAAIARLNTGRTVPLRIAATYKSTPILMLYYEGGGADFHLQRHLMNSGILTVSCESYPGLDGRAVRLMLPDETSMPLLLSLLEDAVLSLP